MKRVGPRMAGLGPLAVMLAAVGAFMLSANFGGSSASLFATSSTLGDEDKSSGSSGDKPPNGYGPSSSRLGF